LPAAPAPFYIRKLNVGSSISHQEEDGRYMYTLVETFSCKTQQRRRRSNIFVEQMAVNIPVICSLQSQKKRKKVFLSVDLNRFSEQGLLHSIGTGHLSLVGHVKKLTRFAEEFGFHFLVYSRVTI
jgi:hypothetical protein